MCVCVCVCVCVDHSFSYSALTLWMLFLYVEVSFRLEKLPGHLLNFSRPFAAHWYEVCVPIRGVLISEGVDCVQASMELGPEDVSLLERFPCTSMLSSICKCSSFCFFTVLGIPW